MKNLYPQQFAVWVNLLVCIVLANTALAENASEVTQNAPLSISTLIVQSLSNHPDLEAAKADVQSAKASLRSSGQAIYNPELELAFEDTAVKTKSIGISQTIDWGDQKGARTAVAQAELNKALANYDAVIQSFISNLLIRLAENQTNIKLTQLSNETLKLMEEFTQIAERRYQAGDLNQVELNLARLAYSQALMEQANMMSDGIEAREKLRAVMGTMPGDLPELPEQISDPVLNDDLETFLQQLPNIRSLLADVQIAREQVNLRKSEKAWNPTIGISAGSEGDESLIGFNLNIPLNVRNSYSAEVDAAQQILIAREQRAHQAYRDTRASLIVSTERFRNLLKAWNNWRLYGRESVDQQLILIKKLWQSGDISAADYLLQLKQALETQASGLELRNQLWQVAFNWMSLTGSIDNWLNINIESLEKN